MGRQAVDVSLFVIFASVAAVSSVEFKNIKLEEFTTCPDNEELSAEITHYDIERVSKNMISINTTMEIKTELLTDYSVSVDLKKCESSSETHTCTEFMTKNVDDFCDQLPQPSQSWSDYVSKTEPELKCPFKKGTYVTTNAMVDASLVEGAPEGYWLAEIRALDGDEVLACFRITARIWPEDVTDEERDLLDKGASPYL